MSDTGNTNDASDPLTNKTINVCCEPCNANDEKTAATRYCQECKEHLCDDCTKSHGRSKVTKMHKPITVAEQRLLLIKNCQQCSSDDVVVEAESYCIDCEQYLCKNCTSMHARMKATKTHQIIGKEEVKMSPSQPEMLCCPCKEGDVIVQAQTYCPVCEEFYCENCERVHKSMKSTKSHELQIASEGLFEKYGKCEPCKESGLNEIGYQICNECNEILCTKCAEFHCKNKKFKHHLLIPYEKQREEEKTYVKCEPCKEQNKESEAKCFCSECEENLCISCGDQHKAQKRTRGHKLTDGTRHPTVLNCDPCSTQGKNIAAVAFCSVCDNELLCSSCVNHHRAQTSTKSHELSNCLDNMKTLSNKM